MRIPYGIMLNLVVLAGLLMALNVYYEDPIRNNVKFGGTGRLTNGIKCLL